MNRVYKENEIRNISFEEAEQARAATPWDFGNEILYNLCEKHPAHINDSEIIAKIWLIGRSYAAAIERRREVKIGADEFYEQTVTSALKTSDLDELLDELPDKLDDPWNQLGQIVMTHKKLTDLFRKITGLDKRSLASKYLHFHKPDLFFLYDSRASAAIIKVTPKLELLNAIKTSEYDQFYLEFCRRIQWLRDKMKTEYGISLTPRHLDNLLLRVIERKVSKSGDSILH